VHLLTLRDWSSREVVDLIDSSLEIKKSPADYEFCLEGKSLAMIFQKTSTRTRLSFEVAMTQLGGHSIYMDWLTTNLVMADLRRVYFWLR
jgi:ornithine carbamoyltransferase